MAVRNTGLLTLKDSAKVMSLGERKVAEIFVESNPMAKDCPYREMNEKVRHIESLRSDLPEVYYRKANQPIPPSKSTIEDREYKAAYYESKSQMDEKVASRGGMENVNKNREVQAIGHMQAAANELAELFVYGSQIVDHRKTPGLADVFSTLNPAEPTSKQIIDAGGTGSDNTSIWLIYWDESTAFGVYPAGTQSGIKRIDEGRVQIHGVMDDGVTPGTFWGYEERFEVNHGLVIKDYRGVACVRNIDVSDLIAGGVGAADILALMTRAWYKVPAQIRTALKGKAVWYTNSTITAMLHEQALNKVGAGGGVTYANYQGEQVLSFLMAPIREMDAILNTEEAVTV